MDWTAIATWILAGFTAWLCWETRQQAKNAKLAILIPYDLKKDDLNFAAGNLFIFNFTYPIVEDIGKKNQGIYSIGIKNIGDGPALNVHISKVTDAKTWKHTNEMFTIPPNDSLPLLMRAALVADDFDNFQDITIEYEDIFHDKHMLELQTNLTPSNGNSQQVFCPITILRWDMSGTQFPPPEIPLHREQEWRGRYALRQLR